MSLPATVGVLGLGAFGRLLAATLAPHARVLAHDPNTSVQAPAGVDRVSLAEAAAAEAVVLAVNVQRLPDALEAIAPHLRDGALVADVCSVKIEPVRLMLDRLPPHAQILGTHPLFGPQTTAERGGIAGQKIALCPVRAETGRVAEIRDFLARPLGLEVIEVSPDEHDRQMAYVQVLTHLVGHAARLMDLPDLPLGTLAYQRLLQMRRNVERDSPELFDAIQKHNPHAGILREHFLTALARTATEAEAAPTR